MNPMLERARQLIQDGWSLAAAAGETGLDIVTDQDGAPMIAAPGWQADDGNCEVTLDRASSAKEAAEEYVDGGDWGDRDTTSWVAVHTWRTGIRQAECAYCDAVATAHDSDGDPACEDHAEVPGGGVDLHPLAVDTETAWEHHRIAIEPIEPDCVDGEDHDWQAPHEIVGGSEDNPGVWGSGGGVLIERVCVHCGCARTIDTWAQDPTDGEQGLESTKYTVGKYAEEVRP